MQGDEELVGEQIGACLGYVVWFVAGFPKRTVSVEQQVRELVPDHMALHRRRLTASVKNDGPASSSGYGAEYTARKLVARHEHVGERGRNDGAGRKLWIGLTSASSQLARDIRNRDLGQVRVVCSNLDRGR